MRHSGILALFFGATLLISTVSATGNTEISDLFNDADETVEPVEPGSDTQGPTLLEEYQAGQDKFSFSFTLTAASGLYGGWDVYPDFTDPEDIAGQLTYSSVGGVVLATALDIRPYEYLRLHGLVSVIYPTLVSDSLLFGAKIQEIFLDYATEALLAVRAGLFPVAWGNARILNVADLPGRILDVSDLSAALDVQPGWLTGTRPSTWLKAALPLGKISITGLAGFPNDPDDLGLQAMAYGLLLEYLRGKTAFGLGGFYQRDFTKRAALMAKTNLLGYDFFLDTAVSVRRDDLPLLSSTAGLFYQTSTGPDIRAIAELSYNGERDPVSGSIVPDAPEIGGLSSALGLTWVDVGGSPLTIGATWYHAFGDNSGALVPACSLDVAPLVSIRFVLPWVYGEEGSEYRSTMPSETGGYVLGMGVVLVLSSSF